VSVVHFYDAFSVTRLYSVDDKLISEWWKNWKGFGRKRSWRDLRYYPGTRLEGLSKTMKTSIRIAGRRGRDINPRSPEFEARVLTTRQRCSFFFTVRPISEVCWYSIYEVRKYKALWRHLFLKTLKLYPHFVTCLHMLAFYFVTETIMKMAASCDIGQCCLVDIDRRLRGNYCLHHHHNKWHW
jgi:hypothetical protein